MKVCVVISFIVTSTIAYRMHPEMRKNAEECGAENNVDISLLTPEEKRDKMKLFEKKEYKCFAKCLAIKFGVVDENGDPIMDNIKKIFNPGDGALEKIKQCIATYQEEDRCEKVFRAHECVINIAKA